MPAAQWNSLSQKEKDKRIASCFRLNLTQNSASTSTDGYFTTLLTPDYGKKLAQKKRNRAVQSTTFRSSEDDARFN